MGPTFRFLAALLPLMAGTILPGARVEAQGGPPLGVQALQDLSFGEVVAGLESWVNPADPAGAAVFRIRGGQSAPVEIRFLLPPSLTAAGGGTLPLRFGPGDARISPTEDPSAGAPLDPSVPTAVSLPGQPWSFLFLGGMVLPPASAVSGSYSAPVILVLSDLGSQ